MLSLVDEARRQAYQCHLRVQQWMGSRPESDSDDDSSTEISYNMWSEEEDSDR